MRVLVLESDRRAADGAAASLEAAGHEVVGCFEPGGGPFPCRALVEGFGCPVDEGIDVALVVRARPWPRPTSLELGVVCALRTGVPVVTAGHLAFDPWGPWASAATDGTDDVVAVCESRAGVPTA